MVYQIMKDMLIIELKNIIKWFLIINLIFIFLKLFIFLSVLLDYEMASLNYVLYCNVFLEDFINLTQKILHFLLKKIIFNQIWL